MKMMMFDGWHLDGQGMTRTRREYNINLGIMIIIFSTVQ
jgi:hypothetical protein